MKICVSLKCENHTKSPWRINTHIITILLLDCGYYCLITCLAMNRYNATKQRRRTQLIMDMNKNAPDFSSTYVSKTPILGGSIQAFQAVFLDPILHGYTATIVEDSINDEERLTTIIAKFPRSILSQMNTHRVFSRNSASSRARSVKTTITDVMNDPYIPLFTSNQKGMSGKFLSFRNREKATQFWLEGRDEAVKTQLKMLLGDLYTPNESIKDLVNQYHDLYLQKDPRLLNVHKQHSNRVIEPYAWHEALITSSHWDNFFDLRLDIDNAEPEVYAIAKIIDEVLTASAPTSREVHQPFATQDRRLTGLESFTEARENLMISATETAQISYKDKTTNNESTAKAALGEKLLENKHMSPFEHIAFSHESYHALFDLEETHPNGVDKSNFSDNWIQLRRIFEMDSMIQEFKYE